MNEIKKPSTGPFVLEGGVASDREFWDINMNPKEEAMFDDYMLVKAIKEETEKELARRITG